MLLAIHRRLFRWYHEVCIRSTQGEIRRVERDLEQGGLELMDRYALENWHDELIDDLRYHQDKLASLFPQPTTER